MNSEVLFRYNIQSICNVIDSVNEATGETIQLRIRALINTLDNDPFLGSVFKSVFELRPIYKLRMAIDDLFPSIDMPGEAVAQILFVINLMHEAVTRKSFSIFDAIFKLYGGGSETGDFINHVLRAPLNLLKIRLLQLTHFSWQELQDHLSEILFPEYAYRFLTPDTLPPESCINRDRIQRYLEMVKMKTENIQILSKDFDTYVKNHNAGNPDGEFLKKFFSRVVQYGGRTALSAMLNICHNMSVVPYILEADPAAQPSANAKRKTVKRADASSSLSEQI